MKVASIVFSAILIHLFVGTSGQDLCDDVAFQVCQQFALKTDVCGDACLSKLCPRRCGKCPLKCYNCNGISAIADCNTTQICPTLDHNCIWTESLAADFSISYKLGCATKDICVRLFGFDGSNPDSLVIGRKRSNLNGECCSTDLCNNRQPTLRAAEDGVNMTTKMGPMTSTIMMSSDISSTTMIQPLMTTSIPLSNDTKNPTCADVDTTGCQRLFSIKRDMCNDDCMLKACPRTCGKCAECYSCGHVDHPENCTQSVVCQAGEQCYVLETLASGGNHAYRAGCMHEKDCARFHKQAGNVFGKRNDPVELALDGDCCTGDLCNHHMLNHGGHFTTTIPKPTGSGCLYTAASHHCPTGFHLVDGKCFMVGPTTMTYTAAQKYCSNHCSKLAENLSSRDFSALVYIVKSQVFIGAQDKKHNGYFTWNSSGKLAKHVSYLGQIIGIEHRRNCATYSPEDQEFDSSFCTNHFKALCEAPMK